MRFPLLVACSSLLACIPITPLPPPAGASPDGSATPAPGAPRPGNTAAGETTPPARVSVTIRTRCSQTVAVFYGAKPKFGSGTRSTISSGSVATRTFQAGEVFWTIDAQENGLSSVTVSEATREIEIGADCRSLQAR